MKRKTMVSVITKKLNAWLETIEDEKLRKDVKANLLLSGGSIASMFLRTDVNDYDIYIQREDVLKRLVDYYIGTLGDLSKDVKVLWLNGNLEEPEMSSRFMNAYKIAVETLHEGQVKCFFKSGSNKGGMKVESNVDAEKDTFKLKYISPNALSLSDDIQIVTRFTGNAEQIHSTFDFVHATNYFTFEDGLVTNVPALESLLSKELRYQGSKYPLTSIIRFKKFVLRGWTIGAGEILKIMFQISELDLNDPNVLEEQLVGVDVAYFDTLIKILRDKKAEQEAAGLVFKIHAAYLNDIIDKVFNENEDDSN
jgi:hypothetical protein